MNITLVKAVVASIPVSILLAWSAAVFSKSRTLGSTVQLFGALCLCVVVLTHLLEALHLFPFMGCGGQHSAGHYLDLASAIGVAFLAVGLVLRLWIEITQ
jgi:hypothetical protein